MALSSQNFQYQLLARVVLLSLLSTHFLCSDHSFFPTVNSVKIENQLSLQAHLEQRILRTIESSTSLNSMRLGLVELYHQVLTQGYISQSDKDEKLRPYFVSLQGIVEQNLAYELRTHKIKKLLGMIHTPLPATPVCTLGEISAHLVDPSLLEDKRRLFTVQARADTVRHFLDSGGAIYIVYPKGGFEKRTLEQQKIYMDTLQSYSDLLIDYELEIDKLEAPMIGATYLFEDMDNNTYLFSIQASQACAPSDQGTWKLWHGNIKEPHIAQRLTELRDFLKKNNGPNFAL